MPKSAITSTSVQQKNEPLPKWFWWTIIVSEIIALLIIILMLYQQEWTPYSGGESTGVWHLAGSVEKLDI